MRSAEARWRRWRDRRATEAVLGLAQLLLLYGATAALLALLVRPAGRRASLSIAVFLSLLPLAYTAPGFLPGRTLAPTRLFAGVAPWADPALLAAVAAQAGPTNGVLLDPVSQMLPWSRAARENLLFNPAQGSGAALLGNGQSAVLFPSEVVSRLLAPFRAVTYSQAARLLLAAWGAFLLIRFTGWSELAAAVAAAVYVGAGFLQLWRLHPHSLVAATAPWILAAALALWRRPGPRPAVLLAATGALGVAAGHPETLLHVVLFTVLVVPALAALGPTRREPWSALGIWGVVAALLSVMLAAPVLLPFVENLGASTEWSARRLLGRTTIELPLDDAFERLLPAGALLALGDPVAGTWRGRENLAELGGGATGGAALLLAALGIAGATGRTRRAALSWIAVIGLLGLLVGAHAPIVSRPFGWIPLLQNTLLKRLSLWWVLAAVILAAAGVDAITDRLAAAPRRTALGLAAAIAASIAAALTLVPMLLAARQAPSDELLRIGLCETGAVVVALLALALLGARPRTASPSPRLATLGAGLLMVGLIVPRLVLFAHWIPVISREGFYANTAATHVVVDRLNRLPRFGFRVTGLEAALAPHSAAFFGLEEIRHYDPMAFAPYHAFMLAVVEPGTTWIRVIDPRTPALAFLGVRFLLEDPPPPLPDDPIDARKEAARRRNRRQSFLRAGLRIAYEGADAVLWERADAQPRAFFPSAWQVVDSHGSVAAAATIDDFTRLAIVDRAPHARTASPGEEGDNPQARVLALDVKPGSIEADVESAAAAILATSQPAIPGWRLTVDGVAAGGSARRVNGAFLGLVVPPGRHQVSFRFAPASWRLGLALATGGIASMSILLWWDRRRRAG